MEGSLEVAALAVRGAIQAAGRGLIEREALVELIVLCAVAGEHLLVIGPPGTAKSEAVRRVSRALGGQYFEYLLGRFTEPGELFGAVDLRGLREGVVRTETAGMLPEAEIAFLDEVFLGSTAILNTLLSLLNERVFRRGHTVLRSPLRVCVGASNALPEDEALGAFADRFLVQVFVEPVPDNLLEDLLAAGWSLEETQGGAVARVEHLDLLGQAARRADLSEAAPLLAQAVRRLRGEGIALSDRRVVKVQRLIAAAALLAGRSRPGAGDLWPLVFAVPGAEAQSAARTALRPLLERSHNGALSAATAEASLGPLARAERLAQAGRALLAQGRPAAPEALEPWRLRLEGLARELDAGFAPDALPPSLVSLREALVAALQEGR
jgi:MoxR-like ATPase